MDKHTAVNQATQMAKDAGYDPAGYEPVGQKKGAQWEITFRSRSARPRPGDFFTILIDDETGKLIRIIPGK